MFVKSRIWSERLDNIVLKTQGYLRTDEDDLSKYQKVVAGQNATTEYCSIFANVETTLAGQKVNKHVNELPDAATDINEYLVKSNKLVMQLSAKINEIMPFKSQAKTSEEERTSKISVMLTLMKTSPD